MQSLGVVPGNDPPDDISRLQQVVQLFSLQGLPQCPVRTLNDPVLLGTVRLDPLVTQAMFVQHPTELSRDITAPIVAAHPRHAAGGNLTSSLSKESLDRCLRLNAHRDPVHA